MRWRLASRRVICSLIKGIAPNLNSHVVFTVLIKSVLFSETLLSLSAASQCLNFVWLIFVLLLLFFSATDRVVNDCSIDIRPKDRIPIVCFSYDLCLRQGKIRQAG